MIAGEVASDNSVCDLEPRISERTGKSTKLLRISDKSEERLYPPSVTRMTIFSKSNLRPKNQMKAPSRFPRYRGSSARMASKEK